MIKIKYLSLGYFSFIFLISHPSFADPNSTLSEKNTEHTQDSLLYQIPHWIEKTPTVFPPESQHNIVPPTATTENDSWIDQKQYQIRHWKQQTAHRLDDWFGDTDPNQPAKASLRLILDQRWDKHQSYEIEPRIRGKIRLPTLEKKLSIVFGDDSLDNELKENVVISNEKIPQEQTQHFDRTGSRKQNSSIALRWSDLGKKLPFETDVDLGVRSGDDVYLRFKMMKTWPLEHNFDLYAEQIYRYGIDSENYFRTNVELNHQKAEQALLSNQFSLIFADQLDEDWVWQNLTFRQHQFFAGNRFNYGLHTSGYYENSQLRLNSWGPFVSWRQPLWREWFFIQGDLNYLDDHKADHSHHVGVLLRLEALF